MRAAAGSYIPPPELKEVRDLTRLRTKKVQARTSDIQRLGKTLESAGIKLGSVASDITGKGPTAMIEALIDGERRGAVMADLAIGRARARWRTCPWRWKAGSPPPRDECLLHLAPSRCTTPDRGPRRADRRQAAPWRRETELLRLSPRRPGAWTWIAEIGPAPHEWFAPRLPPACLAPGNYVSAASGYGRTSEACTYIKPALVQAAWPRSDPRRLQARYNHLVRRIGREPRREEEGDRRDRAYPAQSPLGPHRTPYQTSRRLLRPPPAAPHRQAC